MASIIDATTFEGLKQMAGADFIGELINTFLEDAPQMLRELRTALEAGDADTFVRAAHSLKSNAATFGATDLAARAKTLEALGRENQLSEAGNQLRGLEQACALAVSELKGLRA